MNREERKKMKIAQKVCSERHVRKIKRDKIDLNVAVKAKVKVDRWKDKRWNVRQLKDYIHEDAVSPHPLYIISDALYEKWKDNCILLSTMIRSTSSSKSYTDGGITSFEVISYGKNIKFELIHEDYTSKKQIHYVDIKTLVGNCILIVCPIEEQCLLDDPSIVYVPKNNMKGHMVLLSCCIDDIDSLVDSSKTPVWDNDGNLRELRMWKKSTIKLNDPNHHYGSHGECFSFGLRNSFAKLSEGGISICKYSGDNSEKMTQYKEYLQDIFRNVFSCFDQIILGVSKRLNMNCTSMIQLSRTKNRLSTFLREQIGNDLNFMLTANINVGATTRDFHCEKDTTYTTICVPKQSSSSAFILFEFQLNTEHILRMRFSSNSCFTYSAYCLTHRQQYANGPTCMNVSTYSGKRLYCHFRKSLKSD